MKNFDIPLINLYNHLFLYKESHKNQDIKFEYMLNGYFNLKNLYNAKARIAYFPMTSLNLAPIILFSKFDGVYNDLSTENIHSLEHIFQYKITIGPTSNKIPKDLDLALDNILENFYIIRCYNSLDVIDISFMNQYDLTLFRLCYGQKFS